ncbi:MAG: hypothetical protein H0T76_24490 [Nannocystis sp.]|nr:hypothetical protein [Nannocystis sp.]MBA3549649.1 hypothetical protein [Nannocystis sp.]
MLRQTHECDAAMLVRRHLAEFLERGEARAGPLPAFVKGELEGFAGCGDFELGFVRTCCRTCGVSFHQHSPPVSGFSHQHSPSGRPVSQDHSPLAGLEFLTGIPPLGG